MEIDKLELSHTLSNLKSSGQLSGEGLFVEIKSFIDNIINKEIALLTYVLAKGEKNKNAYIKSFGPTAISERILNGFDESLKAYFGPEFRAKPEMNALSMSLHDQISNLRTLFSTATPR